MTQVDKKAYYFSTYSTVDRWVSYYYQLQFVLECLPKTILEIGVGDKVFGSYIKQNTDIKYTSLDYDQSVKPDVVADVLALPFKNNEFDLICIFEVLEHIQYNQFENALKELSRVSKKDVIISLPHFGPPIKFSFKIPFLPEIKLSYKIPFFKKHIFNGQHYWEIGKKGYSKRTIRNMLSKYFYIKKEFIPFENQYHHFYILQKK